MSTIIYILGKYYLVFGCPSTLFGFPTKQINSHHICLKPQLHHFLSLPKPQIYGFAAAGMVTEKGFNQNIRSTSPTARPPDAPEDKDVAEELEPAWHRYTEGTRGHGRFVC